MDKQILLATAAAILTMATPAGAQKNSGPAPETDNVPDIVVTATKRAANLIDVPIAVSAYSADQLAKSGVTDVVSLQSLAPSLTVSSSASESLGTEFRVRGVGTVGLNPGLESAVATYVDGVYRNRSNVSPADLPGIERIELLRGPQGTLFGKNTSAGVVSILTAAPSFATRIEGQASYGNYNMVSAQASVTGGLVGTMLAARVDGAYTRADGWISDVVVNRRYKNKGRGSLRGQLLFEPSQDLTLRLIADYGRRDEAGYSPDFYRVLGPTAPALQALGGVLVTGADSLRNTKTYDQGENVEEGGVSLQADWKTSLGTLSSITAWRRWKHKVGKVDIDHNNLDLIYVNGAYETFDTFTQELRLAGSAGKVDYLVGTFYAKEDLDVLSRYKIGASLEPYIGLLVGGAPVLAGALGLPAGAAYPTGAGSNGDLWRQNSETFALFTHNTLHITDALSLTAGLRWAHETKTLNAVLSPVTSPACQAFLDRGLINVPQAAGLYGVTCIPNFDPRFNGIYSGKRAEDQWSGSVSLGYEITPRAKAYASYSRGTKSGGFNLDRAGFRDPFAAGTPSVGQLAFDRETVDAYELGLKVRAPAIGLQLNTALFYSTFKNFQVTYNTGAGLITTNVPEAISKGIEVEGQWSPDKHVDLSLAVTHSLARYGTISAASNPSIAALSHTTLPNAPEWTVTGSAGYSGTVTPTLDWFAYADGRWQSLQQTDALGSAAGIQNAYTTVNARAGIGRHDKIWGLEFWVRNLTDKRAFHYTSAALFQPGSFVGIVNEPRTFGATLRTRF